MGLFKAIKGALTRRDKIEYSIVNYCSHQGCTTPNEVTYLLLLTTRIKVQQGDSPEVGYFCEQHKVFFADELSKRPGVVFKFYPTYGKPSVTINIDSELWG